MKHQIVYADPAGNITAIVRGNVSDRAERRAISEEILASGKAEQVGFEATPKMGGDCRLEMMGGEFCGNAVRAIGLMYVSERYDGGVYNLRVEITGADEPVPVAVDLDAGQAFARMPLPVGLRKVKVDGREYPVIVMDGIEHMVVDRPVSEEEREHFVNHALSAMDAQIREACGIMFLEGNHMTPVVYVRETGSLVWESSCGSGSVACGWYLTNLRLDCQHSGEINYLFQEPGGELQVSVTVDNFRIVQIFMGGHVAFLDEE